MIVGRFSRQGEGVSERTGGECCVCLRFRMQEEDTRGKCHVCYFAKGA